MAIKKTTKKSKSTKSKKTRSIEEINKEIELTREKLDALKQERRSLQ